MIELTRVFRQSDQDFVRMLGEVRRPPPTTSTHPPTHPPPPPPATGNPNKHTRRPHRPVASRVGVVCRRQVREGRVSSTTATTLQELIRPLQSKEGIEPTKLYPTNNEVDSINTRRLSDVRA